MFSGPSTAIRFSGSLANAVRRAASSPCAPFCQASDSATTWSICTASLVPWPRRKLIARPEYGSARTPVSTTQLRVPGLNVSPVRSRARMSLRVSQPLRSTSTQPAPNSSRSYPVRGARPLTPIAARAARAVVGAAACTASSAAGSDSSPPVCCASGTALFWVSASVSVFSAAFVAASSSVGDADAGVVGAGSDAAAVGSVGVAADAPTARATNPAVTTMPAALRLAIPHHLARPAIAAPPPTIRVNNPAVARALAKPPCTRTASTSRTAPPRTIHRSGSVVPRPMTPSPVSNRSATASYSGLGGRRHNRRTAGVASRVGPRIFGPLQPTTPAHEIFRTSAGQGSLSGGRSVAAGTPGVPSGPTAALRLEVGDRLLDLRLVLGLTGLLDHLRRDSRRDELPQHACHACLLVWTAISVP